METLVNYVVKCQVCSEPLGLDTIKKTQTVRNQYSALSFECDHCGATFNQVFRTEYLIELIELVQESDNSIENLVKVFAFDLECVNTVEDFMMYAGARNVPRERGLRKCGCVSCGD